MGRFSTYLKKPDSQVENKTPTINQQDLIEEVVLEEIAVISEPSPLVETKRDQLMEMKVKLHNRLIDEFDLTSLESTDGTPEISKIFDIVKTLASEENLKLNNKALR